MNQLKKLDGTFYDRPKVLEIARELLGKILVTHMDGLLTSGRIVETEAYAGIIDRASHAYGGRRTVRNEVMYQPAGTAYIYLCYGVHHLFNVVTNKAEVPHAILVRALNPLSGIETMLKRTGKRTLDFQLTRGPGNLSKAMGLHTKYSGYSLLSDKIYIAEDDFILDPKEIVKTTRIGVDYAGRDASRKFRFIVKGNPYVSGGRKMGGGG
ncbi:MAG: DNA-3-methyladenine glycosylase [Chitinophagales bacterium]